MLVFSVYAVIQIITEMLPISSSGHVMLAQHGLLWFGIPTEPIPEWFDHFLHGPTLLILALYFSRDWVWITKGLVRGCLRRTAGWWRLVRVIGKIMFYVGLADGVTACMYLTYKKWLEVSGIAQHPYVMVVGMAITMVVLASSAFVPRSGKHTLTKGSAALLGFVQGLAFLPGLSRFGSTYVVARWLGISHRKALQFSFVMFIPLIVAAFAFHGIPGAVVHPDVAVRVVLPCLGASIIAYAVFGFVDWLAGTGRLQYLALYMLLPIYLMLSVVMN